MKKAMQVFKLCPLCDAFHVLYSITYWTAEKSHSNFRHRQRFCSSPVSPDRTWSSKQCFLGDKVAGE